MARRGDSRLCKVLPAELALRRFNKPGKKTAPFITCLSQVINGAESMVFPAMNGLRRGGRPPYCFFQRFSVGKNWLI